MTNKSKQKKQQRLDEIENRKIEILLEIAKINDSYNNEVSRLNSEYARLHEEHYRLQVDIIKKAHKNEMM
jgi:hypothetical protein